MSKVFGIGLQKTGTSTLGRALEIMEYRVKHNFDIELVNAILSKNLDVILDESEKWDAFQDNPWPVVYKEMDIKYPDAKFILTLRNEHTWIKSIIKHYGKKEYDFEKWFYGVSFPVGNEKAYIERYERHTSEVRDYFKDKPDKLLIVDWEAGDGWDKLCSFLKKRVPMEPFPHWNKNKTFFDYIRKRKRGFLMRLKGFGFGN